MKRIVLLALAMLLLPSLLLLLAPSANADRGMVPVSDVSIYGPGQKAIIAWNGEEEILILSTDLYASGDSMVLELLPLPSAPQRIEQADFASFLAIEETIEEHLPPLSWWDRKLAGGEGIDIVFHQKIGAHDITVVSAGDAAELVSWAQGFLEDMGMEADLSSVRLENLVTGYIERGMEFFVFDLVEVTSEPKSIEPIVYQFETDFLYYPLVISSLASGYTEITLFLLTPGAVNLAELPPGLDVGYSYGRAVRFQLDEGELGSIDLEVAELLGGGAWLTAVKYEGDLEGLESDLILYSGRRSPELALVYGDGGCASISESWATISVRGDRVYFTGSVIAATPCHELRAQMADPVTLTYPPIIEVEISAMESHGVCVQCIGEIPFEGEIRHLDPGDYDIVISCQGSILAQGRVEIPELEPLQLPLGATLEVDPAQESPLVVDGAPVEPIPSAIEAQIEDSSAAPATYREITIGVDEIRDEVWVTANGISARTEGPIRIEDSQLFLVTSQGPLAVRAMPDDVLGVLPEQRVHSLELMAVDDVAVYSVEGIARARLFGLIPLDMRVETTVDAGCGEVLQQETPWWAFFCSLPPAAGGALW